MLKEYDVVRLRRSVSTIPLPLSTEGTVLIVHPAVPPAYEVEFLDDAGKSLGIYTVEDADLELVSTDD